MARSMVPPNRTAKLPSASTLLLQVPFPFKEGKRRRCECRAQLAWA
jgi:hypothetical protein